MTSALAFLHPIANAFALMTLGLPAAYLLVYELKRYYYHQSLDFQVYPWGLLFAYLGQRIPGYYGWGLAAASCGP